MVLRARLRTDRALGAGRFISGSHCRLLDSGPLLENNRNAGRVHWSLARQEEGGAFDRRAFLTGPVLSWTATWSGDPHESLTSGHHSR